MKNNYIEIIQSIKLKVSDIETILLSLARYIEENNNISVELNHWDKEINLFNENERVFYKVWSWLLYIELESFIEPVQEYKVVFGVKNEKLILDTLKLSEKEKNLLIEKIALKNGAGEELLNWFESKL